MEVGGEFAVGSAVKEESAVGQVGLRAHCAVPKPVARLTKLCDIDALCYELIVPVACLVGKLRFSGV